MFLLKYISTYMTIYHNYLKKTIATYIFILINHWFLNPSLNNSSLLCLFHSAISFYFWSLREESEFWYSEFIFDFFYSSSSSIVLYACLNFLTSSSAFIILSFYCSWDKESYFLIPPYFSAVFLVSTYKTCASFLRYSYSYCCTTCSYFYFLRVYIRELRLLHMAKMSY